MATREFNIKLIKLLPKCIVQYIFINYLDIESINKSIIYYPQLFNNDQKKICKRINKGFSYCCFGGYLEETKLTYYHNKISNDNYEMIFMASCKNGNIEIIKWLCSLKHICGYNCKYYNVFINSCINGNTECAKYLYSINGSIGDVNLLFDYGK